MRKGSCLQCGSVWIDAFIGVGFQGRQCCSTACRVARIRMAVQESIQLALACSTLCRMAKDIAAQVPSNFSHVFQVSHQVVTYL